MPSETLAQGAATSIYHAPYGLEVVYTTRGPEARSWGDLDQPVTEVVGVGLTGSGTRLESGDRDLQFRFSTEAQARAAAERVRKAFPDLRLTLIEWTEAGSFREPF